MLEKEITCIICPKGCKLCVKKNNDEVLVSGNLCKRGIQYGIQEIINPLRKITSTVKIENAIFSRLPVITDKEIAKELIFKVMAEINKVCVKAPIKMGEVIIKNVLNTDVNIIASRSMEKIINSDK